MSRNEDLSIDEILKRVYRALEKGSPYPGCPGSFVTNLISIDSDGYPSSRSVVAREMSNYFTYFRIQTKMDTRKVQELKENSRASLTYVDSRGKGGWATFAGETRMEDRPDGEVDIHFDMRKVEVVNYNENILVDGRGYKPHV